VYNRFGSEQGDDRWAEARRAAESARAAELGVHCHLLRDLFGDHLEPLGEAGKWLPFGFGIAVHPERQECRWCLLPRPRKLVLREEWLAWNAGTVTKLAQAIYDEEAFDRLPILADALEESGCTETSLLNHLRGHGTHVRGCWALDLILGKT
jgi:hypothetical protein